jgi:hypothetical protein
MRRIRFDSNASGPTGAYVLQDRDLPADIQEGERVIIWMDDLEGEAIVERIRGYEWGEWFARADDAKWRDIEVSNG